MDFWHILTGHIFMRVISFLFLFELNTSKTSNWGSAAGGFSLAAIQHHPASGSTTSPSIVFTLIDARLTVTLSQDTYPLASQFIPTSVMTSPVRRLNPASWFHSWGILSATCCLQTCLGWILTSGNMTIMLECLWLQNISGLQRKH